MRCGKYLSSNYYPILQVSENQDPEVTFLTLQDTESSQLEMIVTIHSINSEQAPGHPFYLEVNTDASSRPAPQGHEELAEPWVGAGDLKVGDKIRQADGTTGTVRIVKTEQKNQTMYNLDVANLDNFYVGEQGWLVHNTLCPKINYQHIFFGEIDNGVVKGFHHVSGLNPNGRVVQVIGSKNAYGIYTAQVEVFDNTSGAWLKKFSTMFPDDWSQAKVLDEIAYAYEHAHTFSRTGDYWIGPSRSGFDIQGYTLGSDINTAFPVY